MNFFLVGYTIFSWSDKDKLRWKLIQRYFRSMDDAAENGRSWNVQNKWRTWTQSQDRSDAYKDVTGRLESSTCLLLRSPVRKINLHCVCFVLFLPKISEMPTQFYVIRLFLPILVSAKTKTFTVTYRLTRSPFPVDISPGPVVSAIMPQLFPVRGHIWIHGRQAYVSALATELNRLATNFADRHTITVGYWVRNWDQ